MKKIAELTRYGLHIYFKGNKFIMPLTAYDVLNAFILVAGCSFAGGALGSLLHPRVMEDRKLAVVLTVLFSVLTVVRTGLVQEITSLKYVAWILPPVDRVSYIWQCR